MRSSLLPALLLLVANSSAVAPIEVSVSGIRSAEGMVRVSVCPERLFLKLCPYSASVPAHAGEVIVLVPNVPPGRYAVQAFHDADADNKLGSNWIGLPREGIGFSNDAMPRLLPPRFSAAAFDHGSTPQRVALKVRYFLG
jgi:uncharacterized protein (DUF2141 family)